MSKEDEVDDKRKNIRDKFGIICDYIYCFLPILLAISLVVLIVIALYNFMSHLCTKQTGYLLASCLLIFGLLGLWLDNTSFYQQQSFKLLIWVGIIILVFTLAFSIALDILRLYKSNNGFSVLTSL